MDLIWEGLRQATVMLLHGDPEVWRITALTLRVSGVATLISILLGVPVGVLLGLSHFPGRRFLISFVNTGMGLPPVVVGLWVSLFLWRSGPLGSLHLIYTSAAIVIAQCIIATPVVASLTVSGIAALDPKLRLQILSLGASRLQLFWLLLREARLAIFSAVIAGFGSVVSEVGASNMVGGNLPGETRVLTTAIMSEVSRAHYPLAIAISVVLLLLAYGVTAVLTYMQQRERHA